MALVKTEDLMAQVQGFSALPGVKQVGLMIGLAASIALAVAVVLWSQSPNYSLLYANLSGQDLASVATSLDDANIPYKVEHASGSILVPSSKVHDLRLRLAASGLPESEEVGFELLEKKSGFGTSRFLEKARYQRALEGELAKSVNSLSSVESARVHLAIPKQSVFVRDRAKPSASVLVKLRAGGKLNDSQIAGIVHLVAASVPGLEPQAVTVVDQKGRLLSESSDEEGLALSADRFEYSRRIEEEYTRRIMDMLTPVVGLSGVRAQVTADLDFTIIEQTRETYQPEQKTVRSEQIREQQNVNGDPGGVPGALSNQPPRGGTLNPTGVEGETTRSSSKEVVRNYEVDRTISHSRFAPGRIKRLSVAVMLDYRKQIDSDGQVQQMPLKESEIA
ncbi:MAG TPA: flagellar M-ring protein FliF, partial [Chromatiaceae bacterium]|nr:flagellar M-ring protein FliF [Chromatiaceae bacterium]